MSTMIWSRFQLVLLCVLLHYRVESQQEVLIEESSAVESILAPIGGHVELPCDVSPAITGDRVGLVIWYKQGHETPIYSLDAREGVTSQWSDPSTLGARVNFRSNTTPAVLVLTKLRPEDSGQYRCRVDFIKSPTKNSRLNLTVLIPPERLLILTQDGSEVRKGVLGPYDEDTEVNLTCVAVGGRPTPRVSWWKSHALLANSEGRVTVSFKLHRSDFGTEITCQAVTDPSMSPLSESLSIDMNLRPILVRIQGSKRPLVAAQSTELTCQVIGARPKPLISWWKGGTKLTTVKETVSLDGNVTSSVLTFVPAIEDTGKVLSCRAVQPTLSHSIHEDGWKMVIRYLPVVTLNLGANLDADKVIEGSDVYLDCKVHANPWHSHVYFTHNDVIVKPNPRVLLANQSLVLQQVSRKAAGAYVCSAKNALGEGYSKPLHLDVKYPPTCKWEQPTVIRAARGEVVEIQCELDANPKDSISYNWWFNSSTHSKHELKTSVSSSAQKNLGTFLYGINTSEDYGWVQCTGTNAVGQQSRPCLYQILSAEKPSAVKGCEITNVTYDSLTLNCTPGFDGGVRQSFLLEVFEMSTGAVLRNLTNDEASFVVSGLSTNSFLSLSVRAYNGKGSSEAYKLTSSLLKYPERRIAQVPVKVELTTLLITVLVAVGLLTVTAAVSSAVCYCRYCNKNRGKTDKNEKEKRPKSDTSDVPLTGVKKTDSSDSLDKNPDIIPISSKISDSCSTKSSATDYSSIRPLMSKTNLEKYELPSTFNTFHNINASYQYDPCHPMNYRLPPTFQPGLTPMPNIGSKMYRQPQDMVYEDWLRYKHALPFETGDVLPIERIRPPEKFASYVPHNPVHISQIPDLEYRYHLEPSKRTQELNISSYTSPVRFSTENNTVYYTKNVPHATNSLPRMVSKKVTLCKQRSTEATDGTLIETEKDDSSNVECH